MYVFKYTYTLCATCIGDTGSFAVVVDQCIALLDSAPTAKDLLTCLLKMDPAYRMSASQILETPWITVRQRFLSGRVHPTAPDESHQQLFTECFVQQGDTNMPLPSNVLEMMRSYVEESASKTTGTHGFCP